MTILELLKERNILTSSDDKEVEAALDGGEKSLEEVLLGRGVEPAALLSALGEYYKMPTHLFEATEKIETKILQYIPEESARHYQLLPIAVKDGVLEIGVIDPDDLNIIDAVNFISAKNKLPYKLVLILKKDFERLLPLYQNITGEVNEALSALETELAQELKEKERKQKAPEEDNEEHIKEDAPVTKIVATVLRYAVDGRASDIHIEPTREKTKVRFRIDGELMTSLELPLKVHPAVVARIKILASIRLDEKRKPQDGRFSATIDNRRIDFRVSTLPTHSGEKVVMRILDPESGVRTMDMLGMSDHLIAMIRRAIEQPYGIILISGPTGSGKSTTLYALLNEIDRAGKNVVSLEDPIEYDIEGVSQSQVRPEIGYTFASGLRSVLRQDPDIIMVGEIRDKETAQLAIQAALTGHLVLSTIHTNNSVGVIPRLIDMGVDPYLIGPTLILAMAQRLVRRICPGSGQEANVEGSLKVLIDTQFQDLPKEYRGIMPEMKSVLMNKPTDDCPNGTRGRTVVMEGMEVDDELERMILKSASEPELYKYVRSKGFISMKEDAIIKALRHEIPFEEVNTLGGALLANDIDSEEDDPVEKGDSVEQDASV